MIDLQAVLPVAAFAAAWIYQDWKHGRERQQLLDRLMARSLPEFKYEERKEKVLRSEPKTTRFPSDAELAAAEQKMLNQVEENKAEAARKVAALRAGVAAGA